MDTEAQDWVAVGPGPPERLETLSLVLCAVGIGHLLDHRAATVLVRPTDVGQARSEWAAYEAENAHWPPPSPPPPALHPGTPPTWGPMTLLALFFVHTGPWQATSLWFARGAVDSEAVLARGQWWRLVTGLTLHADAAHLVGNCLIGGLIIHLLCRTLGLGTSWLLLLASGAAGNLLNLLLRRGPHLSVGLSTAVFAAVGLLTGRQLICPGARSLRALLPPLGAGAGLLALLGSEGVRTDLGAHLCGFAVGLFAGLFLALVPDRALPRQPLVQAGLFGLAVTALLACWRLALR